MSCHVNIESHFRLSDRMLDEIDINADRKNALSISVYLNKYNNYPQYQMFYMWTMDSLTKSSRFNQTFNQITSTNMKCLC